MARSRATFNAPHIQQSYTRASRDLMVQAHPLQHERPASDRHAGETEEEIRPDATGRWRVTEEEIMVRRRGRREGRQR